MRLQAGFSQPCRVAVAPNQNIENNPMQSSRRSPAGRFGSILDASGKSEALLHRRSIRQTPARHGATFGKPWRYCGKADRAEQAMIAWQQRAGPAERSQG